MDGSLNLAGISDPAVDALIERVIAAKSREELTYRSAGARPRAARRPLLGAALVQAVEQYRLLGQVLAARRSSPASTVAFSIRGGMTRPKLPN